MGSTRGVVVESSVERSVRSGPVLLASPVPASRTEKSNAHRVIEGEVVRPRLWAGPLRSCVLVPVRSTRSSRPPSSVGRRAVLAKNDARCAWSRRMSFFTVYINITLSITIYKHNLEATIYNHERNHERREKLTSGDPPITRPKAKRAPSPRIRTHPCPPTCLLLQLTQLHSPSTHRGIKSAGIAQRSMVFSSVPSAES